MKRSKLYYLTHPSVTLPALWAKFSDRYAIEQQWKNVMGYPLDLENPKTFNEKLQWLKLYDHNPLYTTLVDKYKVKEWVAQKIGPQYVIPTLGVYKSINEIDFDKLPDRFVLKCNHDSGSVCICKDKRTFDKQSALKKLDSALKKNFFYHSREWAYKNVKPLIIAEPYFEDEISHDLPDFKFFSYNGLVKYMFVACDRNNSETETKFDFYDLDFNHLDVKNIHPNADTHMEKPQCYEEMIRLASILSEGIPHVRVDFYQVNGKVYFGEMTLYHWAGMTKFEPMDFDYLLGRYLVLPPKRRFRIRPLRFRKIKRIIRKLKYGDKTTHLLGLIDEGLKIGHDVHLIEMPNFGSEPYLISIGNNTTISFDVAFVTHDAGAAVIGRMPNEDRQTGIFGPIKIGNNCFVGCRTTILANVHIGDNVIIGPGSVVNRDIPSNSIAAGVPCKVICTIDEYKKKHKDDFIYCNLWPYEKKKAYLRAYFADELNVE